MVLASVTLVACGASQPTDRPAKSFPAAVSSTAPSAPAGILWRPERVLPSDPIAFAAAEMTRDVVGGARTTWTQTAAGSWMPAEEIGVVDRLGLVRWRNRWVSWSDGNVVRVSGGGLEWTDARAQPDEGNPTTLVPVGDELLLFGEGTRRRIGAWRSADATTWVGIDRAPIGMRAGVDIPGSGLLSVGSIGEVAAAWLMTGETSWANLPFPPRPVPGISEATGVTATAGRIVAIGNGDGGATAWTTSDLTAWVRVPAFGREGDQFEGVTVIGGLFAIVGRRADEPMIWLSPDGVAWSPSSLPVDRGVEGDAVDVAIVDGRAVAFGWATKNAGNGGASRTRYLVWSAPLGVAATRP